MDPYSLSPLFLPLEPVDSGLTLRRLSPPTPVNRVEIPLDEDF